MNITTCRSLIVLRTVDARRQGDAGVEKIALQHGVMLSEHRDDHGGIFRPLAFVNGRRDSALKVVPPPPMPFAGSGTWFYFAD